MILAVIPIPAALTASRIPVSELFVLSMVTVPISRSASVKVLAPESKVPN